MDRRDGALDMCVGVMWECYQGIARTPKDDESTKIFIRARDLHEAIIRENGDNEPSHVASLMGVCKALLVNAIMTGKGDGEYVVDEAVIKAAQRIVREIERGN